MKLIFFSEKLRCVKIKEDPKNFGVWYLIFDNLCSCLSYEVILASFLQSRIKGEPIVIGWCRCRCDVNSKADGQKKLRPCRGTTEVWLPLPEKWDRVYHSLWLQKLWQSLWIERDRYGADDGQSKSSTEEEVLPTKANNCLLSRKWCGGSYGTLVRCGDSNIDCTIQPPKENWSPSKC